ncbi:hypothetical protein MAR_011332 [Mya arenaria]|uniref:Uncharacterized protein n=1 Tax=Mya arenaria TaxID=6604 RepID=A0ABY7FXM6_MYAAR|nr:uncharacterized protein LOC128218494 [Mya arenaria]WAR25628.1 hypothetical protein MAR_011332 [Mya arenaria]
MEKAGAMRIALLSLGVLSLLFLTVAFFAPGWMVFDMSMNTTELRLSESTKMGLWVISACVNLAASGEGEICKTITMDQLEQSMSSSGNPASKAFLGNMMPIQGLMVCGMLAAVIAFVLLVIIVRQSGSANVNNKNKGIVCAILWAIAAILVISAVGAEGHQNTNMKHSVDLVQTMMGPSEGFKMDIKFPYAILIAAFSAVFSALLCVVLAIQLCKPPEGPGYWNHFTNQPV